VARPQRPLEGGPHQILGILPSITQNGKQKFDIQVSNGQAYSTFRAENASKAQALIGQPVTIMVSDNGQYVNYEDAFPAAAGVPVGQPVQQQFVPQGVPAQPAQQFTPAAGFVDQEKLARDQKITRGNATNAVSSLLGPLVGTGFYSLPGEQADQLDIERLLGDFFSLTAAFGRYIATAKKTTDEAPAEVPIGDGVPAEPTPEQIAAWAAAQGAAGVQVGAPVASASDAGAPPEEGAY
jgi:hypothetical protein